MDVNPEFKREKEEESRLWRAEMTAYCEECLGVIQGFVPPQVGGSNLQYTIQHNYHLITPTIFTTQIFSASLASLTQDDGYSPELAKRLIAKKCLWLVRITAEDIERMHIAELQGTNELFLTLF